MIVQFYVAAYLLLSLSSLAGAQSEPTAARLDPVVVTSDLDKQNTPLIIAPGSLIRKDRAAIKANTPGDLGSLLKDEPNIDLANGPRGQNERPQIRGLGSERILILEDGVRQNFQNGHNGRVFSDFSLLESVEVLKGPWSSLYGSGAMGGVLSLRKSTAGDYIRRTQMENGAELALDAGSAAESFGQRATAFARAGSFEPLISYHREKSNDLLLSDGKHLPYSAGETNDFYSSLGFSLGAKQSFNLKLNQYQDKSNTLLEPDPSQPTPAPAGSMITKKDIIGDYQLERGAFDFHAKPYVRQTEIQKIRFSDRRVDTQTVETTGVDTWNNLKFESGEDFKVIITSGVEYFKDQDKGRRGGGSLDSFPDGSGEQWGVYLQPSFTFLKKVEFGPWCSL